MTDGGDAARGMTRFLKFLAVGGLNTLFGYSLFAVFILLDLSTPLALAGSTILGVLFNFITFGRVVFANGDPRLLPRFILFYLGQFAVNLAALRGLESVGLGPIFAQLLLLPPLSVACFILMRKLVFVRPRAGVAP